MYNIIISTVLGAITYAALAFAAKLSWWIALIAAVAVMLGAFVLISRIIM
ncbi:MAG: hypothetical protein H6Q56_1752, partial [Deltaproteobacteria bacterium]|nr:hypothetical protein [Deltaproteobacteria bacterium]